MSDDRFDRYRRLFERLDRPAALALIDRLQLLALSQPDTLREIEDFLDRHDGSSRLPLGPNQSPAVNR